MRVLGFARWLTASSATSPSHVIPMNCLDASRQRWSAPRQANIIDGPGPPAAMFATSLAKDRLLCAWHAARGARQTIFALLRQRQQDFKDRTMRLGRSDRYTPAMSLN